MCTYGRTYSIREMCGLVNQIEAYVNYKLEPTWKKTGFKCSLKYERSCES